MLYTFIQKIHRLVIRIKSNINTIIRPCYQNINNLIFNLKSFCITLITKSTGVDVKSIK
jgi:hypothetical protein